MNQDQQFDAVIAAVANYSRRPQKTPEQLERERREAHRADPKHIKALARRRKRKNGGPK